MSEPENGNPWDDLVADLGLPTDAPKPVVDEPAVEATVEEPAPHRGRRRRAPAVAAEAESPPLFAEPVEPATIAAPTEEIAVAAEHAPEGEAATTEGAAAEPGEEATPRGRSRRRRRGRGKGAANAAAPVAGASASQTGDEAPPTAEVQEAAQPAPRRSRRRPWRLRETSGNRLPQAKKWTTCPTGTCRRGRS